MLYIRDMDTTTSTHGTDRFICGEALRYTGPDAEEAVNRTVLAPYGPNADVVSFRRYDGFGVAEVMTSRGSRMVAVEHLVRVTE